VLIWGLVLGVWELRRSNELLNEPEMTRNQMAGNTDEKIGAVMVVGGGIAGIQASLDLAESGYYVYLVESSPAIGGVMAQLDKTFPTNDCSMCIISPKLVEAGRHLNINILTATDVEAISGKPGNFTVRLRKHARFVDTAKCTGCGDCAAACPIIRPDEFNALLSTRKAVYKRYPQAIPNAFAIEKRGEAPCRNACPIEQRAMGYVALIREKRFAEAYRTIKEDNPFPSVCGRVCNHRCEEACTRNEVGSEPVNIMHFKRFVTDWAFTHPEEIQKVYASGVPKVPDRSGAGKKVAIVGAGPAGLTAANDLIQKSYSVTVFESLPAPGGMMRVGIPEYRMPYDLLQREIDEITSRGVELKLNHRVKDVAELLRDNDAVFVASGAHVGIKLPIPGNDLPEVHITTDFLREVSVAGTSNIRSKILNKRVLVLGGGNVAIDAAMVSVRLGARWVGMSCLESREKMPAHDWEIRDAQEEGIDVYPGRTFKEVTQREGHVTGVRTVDVNFRGFIEGRPDFNEISGTETIIPCDVVIFAIGQKPDLTLLNNKVETVRSRTVAVDKETLATNVPGLFAGGDVVTGTTFVVDAISAGHKAARSIDAYLTRGKESRAWPPVVEAVEKLPEAKLDADQARQLAEVKSQASRPVPAKREAGVRKQDFSEVESTLTEEEVVEAAKRCLECGICSECLQCVFACRAEAINHNDRDKRIDLHVGAVILTPGFKTVEGNIRPEFGYGVYPNVVTSLEFERMLSASGPYAGVVQRPSDAGHPRKIAFIQCVGSRDISSGRDYCSSVCCMYATKEAIIAKEHANFVEPTIFYMDVRAYGKGFDAYYERAKSEYGVRFIRCMVSRVKEHFKTKNLLITYLEEGGKMVEEEFDLVVLSVGMVPSKETVEMAKRVGVEVDTHGFCKTKPFEPTSTSKPGVYVCGVFQGPKDIPETVSQASGAVAGAAGLIASARGTMVTKKEYPPEADVTAEEPRIGVFVCNCGINIGGVVNVPEVREYARTLKNVVHVEDNLYTCSQDTQGKIKEAIKEHHLNRVIVASCSPRTHEPMFRETCREAGINKYLFEMANIRDQCSWVHMRQKGEATLKAKDLVRMAVANARWIRPLREVGFPVIQKGLVIGGGVAGMTAALKLAEQGYEIFLLEKEAQLGGNLKNLYYTLEGQDVQAFLKDLINRVTNHASIHIITNALVVDFSGSKGNFSTGVMVAPTMYYRKIEHGITVLATGAQEWKPDEYLYGEDPRIVTQLELENQMVHRPDDIARARHIVMIQCVGSRNKERPNCSRTCCATAVKNALKIKERNPHAQISIFYRDMRTYGLAESYYAKAREQGILFIRYELEEKPEVKKDEQGLTVSYLDRILREKMEIKADLVVLSAATIPRENEELATMLKVPRTMEGFFLEAHMKLRPVDFATDGMYLAGGGHGPKLISESITQANAAAARACTILSKEKMLVGGVVAVVEGERCAACLTCVRVCPYEVPVINAKGEAEIDLAKCKGCGSCAAECPARAIELMHFRDPQLWAKCEALVMDINAEPAEQRA
jgi:heterodisulfide reductase subunit A-like polyferredoxin